MEGSAGESRKIDDDGGGKSELGTEERHSNANPVTSPYHHTQWPLGTPCQCHLEPTDGEGGEEESSELMGRDN